MIQTTEQVSDLQQAVEACDWQEVSHRVVYDLTDCPLVFKDEGAWGRGAMYLVNGFRTLVLWLADTGATEWWVEAA